MTAMDDTFADDWRRYAEAFSQFVRLEKGLSSNSLQAYMNDLHHLSSFAVEHQLSPTSVALDDMQALLAEMNDTGIAVATQCRMISGWRVFFDMMVANGDIGLNPAKLLQMPQRPSRLPDVLTDDDIANIQSTFDRSMPDQDRNYVIVEVLYGCGLRVSELVNMKLSNIYVEEECLRIIGKGSKERVVYFDARTKIHLQNYLDERTDNNPAAFFQRGRHAGADSRWAGPLDPHGLRHGGQRAGIGGELQHRAAGQDRMVREIPARVAQQHGACPPLHEGSGRVDGVLCLRTAAGFGHHHPVRADASQSRHHFYRHHPGQDCPLRGARATGTAVYELGVKNN